MAVVASTPSPRVLPKPMTPSMFDNMPDSSMQMPVATPPGKRKVEEDVRADGKENGAGKRAKVDNATGILDVARRKVNFTQPPFTFDSHRRLKLDFEGCLLDAQDEKKEISAIPEEHWKYITLAGSELTSSSESLFINHLRKALEPQDLSGIITPAAWTSLIPQLFTLEQYGVYPTDFPSSSSSSSARRIPVSLQIRSWEPKKLEYLTAEQQATLNERREARREARTQIEAALKALDDIELFELAKGDKGDKGEDGKVKEKKRIKPMTTASPVTAVDVNAIPDHGQTSPAQSMGRKSREGTAGSATGSRRSASPVKKVLTAEEEEALRQKLEEKEAKRVAAEEKKAAKEEKRLQKEKEEAAKEQERQRKEAAMAKQKAAMNSFFKPKLFGAAKKVVAGPSSSKPCERDFDRIFKPVALRPNVDWAPVNRFKSRNTISKATLLTDDADPVAAHLQQHSRMRTSRRQKIRTDAPFGTVGEKWDEYQNSPDPRAVLAQLKNTRKFPWKMLSFDQQTRPPYCGTFTKRSAVVGARTPFAQDPLFDYSYDSGDDWQEEEGGDDVDDPEAEAELSDAESDNESEGEFDDWLDDEDEAMMTGDEDNVSVGTAERADKNSGVQTKLGMKQAVKRDKVKKVVKLAPFVKGPCWEDRLGETDGLDVYRIQLLNDTPTGIDPFTYTAPASAQVFKCTYTTTSVGAQLAVKTLMSTEPMNAKADPTPAADDSTTGPAPAPTTATPARPSTIPTANADPTSAPRRAPKVLFPDSHLAELLQLVEGNTRIQTDIVSQLKAHFEGVASKAAIELKLKEVASRQGKSKESAWKVTPEAWAAAGLAPPAPLPSTTAATAQPSNAPPPVPNAGTASGGDVFT